MANCFQIQIISTEYNLEFSRLKRNEFSFQHIYLSHPYPGFRICYRKVSSNRHRRNQERRYVVVIDIDNVYTVLKDLVKDYILSGNFESKTICFRWWLLVAGDISSRKSGCRNCYEHCEIDVCTRTGTGGSHGNHGCILLRNNVILNNFLILNESL